MIMDAWHAVASVIGVENASTPIIVALITAVFAFAGTIIVAVKTVRIDNRKANLDEFKEMRANWKAEIADLRRLREADRVEIARLTEAGETDRKRIARLEEELLLSHRREAYLMEQLGVTTRPPDARERGTDGVL